MRRLTPYVLGAVAATVTVNMVLLRCFACPVQSMLRGGRLACSATDFGDNIGGVDLESRLSYDAIDVVYTWVNGSDPVWLERKEKYNALRAAHALGSAAKTRRRLLADDYGDPHADGDHHADDRYQREDDWAGAADYKRQWPHDPDDGHHYGDYGDDAMRTSKYDGYNKYEYDASEYESSKYGVFEDPLPDLENAHRNPVDGNATGTNNASSSDAAGNATVSQNQTAPPPLPEEAPKVDESASASRYRDSGELRYSLRSLERYAPWVRHVYLVTDDQIPNWLDVDSKRLTVVPHSAIFGKNRAALPVFSSPAIEAHLHKIPGLSRRFIYFNDDVMLGAPTWPDDFVRLDGTQRVYLAWEVPKCAEGCVEAWIGDGSCDPKCDVRACDHDGGDCVSHNATEADAGAGKRGRGKKNKGPSKYGGGSASYKASLKKQPRRCAAGCTKTWLGDGVCDRKCNTKQCAWDGGDCGGPSSRTPKSAQTEPWKASWRGRWTTPSSSTSRPSSGSTAPSTRPPFRPHTTPRRTANPSSTTRCSSRGRASSSSS